MQFTDAQHLRDTWGDKSCDHPGYDKEYYLGADTMDKVCTQCGNLLSDEEIAKIKNRKKQR